MEYSGKGSSAPSPDNLKVNKDGKSVNSGNGEISIIKSVGGKSNDKFLNDNQVFVKVKPGAENSFDLVTVNQLSLLIHKLSKIILAKKIEAESPLDIVIVSQAESPDSHIVTPDSITLKNSEAESPLVNSSAKVKKNEAESPPVTGPVPAKKTAAESPSNEVIAIISQEKNRAESPKEDDHSCSLLKKAEAESPHNENPPCESQIDCDSISKPAISSGQESFTGRRSLIRTKRRSEWKN